MGMILPSFSGVHGIMIQITARMPVGYVLAMLLSLFLLWASGCQAAKHETETKGEPAPRVALTSDDSGKTVVLRPGDIMTIRLAEKPSAGYRWVIETYNDQVVGLKGKKYVRAEGAAVGGGGHRTLTFEAKTPGVVTLNLKLWQPWVGEASVVDRFSVTLDIQS